MLYILIATPFIMGAFVLNNIMRLQGNAKMGVIGIASGAVLNVALDPIMIWVMDMGTAGAGLATGLSQLISFGLLLFLSGRNGGLKISWKNFEVKWKNYKEIIAGGIPSLARQGLGSIASICLNNVAGIYGDPVIAGFSVVNRIMFVLISVLLGFGQGFQPVCGFNYGAGLYQRVKKAFWFCVKVSSVVMLVIAVIIFFNAEPLVRRFSKNDMELIEVGVKALRIQCVSLPLMGFIVLSNMCLQNTRKTVRATIVAMARQGVMLIPAIYILEGLLGLEGLILAQFAADIATFILSIPLMTTALKEMKIQK
jgi:putative MATE family efflux protein